jgi:HEAT repeat protein
MIHPTVLTDIFNPSLPLRNASLTAFSGLSRDEAETVAARSAEAPIDRRLAVARRLLELGEDDATLDFAPVFRAMLGDPEAEVRELAIEGLWEDEERDVIGPLISLLNEDPDVNVRRAAARSLGRFVVLNEFDAVRPADAERVLTSLRDVAVDSDEPPEVRGPALESLGASSEPWVDELIWQAYDSDERSLQLSALNAMGRNSDAKWLPTLYIEMQNEDGERRFEAASAAGQIGDEDAVPQLADLFEDPDQEVQEAAISAVGQIGGDVAVELLREHLDDPDERVAEAVRAAYAEAEGGMSLFGGQSPVPGTEFDAAAHGEDED